MSVPLADRQGRWRSIFPIRRVDFPTLWVALEVCGVEDGAEPLRVFMREKAALPGVDDTREFLALASSVRAGVRDPVCSALIDVEVYRLSDNHGPGAAARTAARAEAGVCMEAAPEACRILDFYELEIARDITGPSYDPNGAARIALGIIRESPNPLVAREALDVLVAVVESDVGLPAADLDLLEARIDLVDRGVFDLAVFLAAQRLSAGDSAAAARLIPAMEAGREQECARSPTLCAAYREEVDDVVGQLVGSGHLTPRSWQDTLTGAAWGCHLEGLALAGTSETLAARFEGGRWEVGPPGPFAGCVQGKLVARTLVPDGTAEGTLTVYPPAT